MIFKISYVIKTALIFFLIYDIGFSFAPSITSGRFVFLGKYNLSGLSKVSTVSACLLFNYFIE